MYCTVGEVLEMIKDDMKNVIIGDEYIEDEQEREAKIATLCESGVSDAVFEGTKAANGWKSGRQVEEKEFKEACEAFRKAPVDGSKKDKEAKG